MLIGDKRVQVLEQELTRVRRAFESALAEIPEPRRHQAPAGQWTPAQIIWHVAKVERAVARLIERKTAEIGPLATVPPGPSIERVLNVLDHIPFHDRSRKLEAPEGIRPPAEIDLNAERWRWADGRAQLLAAAFECGPRLSLIRHDHLYFGPFDGWQWVLMVARHEERHLAQMLETAAATA